MYLRLWANQICRLLMLALHLSKLDLFLSGEGSATIYALASWLKALELKLSVAVDEGDKGEEEDSVGGAELAEVGNV